MALTKVSQSMIQGNVISVLDFGAKNDGSNASATTAAIQAAIDFAEANAAVQCIEFPAGIYEINAPIEIKGNHEYGLLINGNNSRIISTHNGIAFDCDASSAPGSRLYLTVRDLVVTGPGAASALSTGFQLYGAGYYLDNVVLYGFFKALYGKGCFISNFNNCTFTFSQFGIFFESSGIFSPNDINFTKCNIIQNNRAIKYTDFDYGVVTFNACEIEANNSGGNATDGIAVCEFSLAGEVNLIGCHFEAQPGQYNIYYDSPLGRHLNIVGNKIIPGDTTGSCIYVVFGELCVIGSHVAQNVGGNIVLTASTGSALVVGDTAGSVTGTLTKLVRIKAGGFIVGNSRYDTLNGTIFINRNAGTGIEPGADNTDTLGSASLRWSTVYAATGTINTSDERNKEQIQDIDAAALRAWGKVKYSQFKFKDAVQHKGSGARWHVGLIAQRVKDAFESEGLDAFAYGLLCYDKWEDQYVESTPSTEIVDESFIDDNGKSAIRTISRPLPPKLAVEAGDRFGIRYEEALALECAYLRSRLN